MANLDTKPIAPSEIIIPRRAIAQSSTLPEGLLFISGGLLHYTSGASIVRLSAGGIIT